MQLEGIPLLAAVLLLFASAAVAREVGNAHPARLAVQILLGAGLGGLPATLIFDQCKRWRPDFGFIFVVIGFALGVVGGAAGTMLAGRVDAGRRSTAWEVIATGVGACAGTWLALVTVCAEERDLYTEPRAMVVAALLVGSFATLGHQLLQPPITRRGRA